MNIDPAGIVSLRALVVQLAEIIDTRELTHAEGNAFQDALKPVKAAYRMDRLAMKKAVLAQARDELRMWKRRLEAYQANKGNKKYIVKARAEITHLYSYIAKVKAINLSSTESF